MESKINWYQLNKDEIFERLQSSPSGLTYDEALKRLEKFGPNRLAEEEKTSRLRILIHQFTSRLFTYS